MSKVMTLEGAGKTLDLYSWLKGHEKPGHEALSGITGFGLSGQTNQWFEGAGDGAIYLGSRMDPRDIVIPVHVQADNLSDLNQLFSDLAVVLSPEFAPARLNYGMPDGDIWYVDVVREEGGDWPRSPSDSDNETWLKTAFTLRAGSPFWTRVRPESFLVRQDESGRGLLPPLAKLEVSSSSAIGTREVVNVGDADADLVWTLDGPFTDFTAIGPRGEKLEWLGTIATGNGLIFNTKEGRVYDYSGANRYNGLSPRPQFWKIPSGRSFVSVSMDAVSDKTRALAEWRPRRRAVI